MSDPRPDLVMSCDMPGCLRMVARAPRIVVPPTTFGLGTTWRPIRVMTSLHYCQPHVDSAPLKPEDVLRPKLRGQIEARARVARAYGFRPDFERASIEWVLVTTPEYRAFLRDLGVQRVFTA